MEDTLRPDRIVVGVQSQRAEALLKRAMRYPWRRAYRPMALLLGVP